MGSRHSCFDWRGEAVGNGVPVIEAFNEGKIAVSQYADLLNTHWPGSFALKLHEFGDKTAARMLILPSYCSRT